MVACYVLLSVDPFSRTHSHSMRLMQTQYDEEPQTLCFVRSTDIGQSILRICIILCIMMCLSLDTAANRHYTKFTFLQNVSLQTIKIEHELNVQNTLQLSLSYLPCLKLILTS